MKEFVIAGALFLAAMMIPTTDFFYARYFEEDYPKRFEWLLFLIGILAILFLFNYH